MTTLVSYEDRTPVGPVSWVLDEQDLGRLIGAVRRCSEFVFDFETTGLDEHAVHGGKSNGGVAARVVLATFTLPIEGVSYTPGVHDPTTWVLPLSHPDSPFLGTWRKVLWRVMQAVTEDRRPVVNQNVKFDCRWTYAHTGIDLSSLITWDTMVSGHLLDENKRTRLKVQAAETFGVDEWDDFDLSFPGAAETIELMHLGAYAARDTYYAWRLLIHHRRALWLPVSEDLQPEAPEEVQDARLGQVATWVAMPTVASLTRIEQNGFALDVPWVRDMLEKDAKAAADALQAMADRYGLEGPPSAAPTSLWFRAWTEAAVNEGDLTVAALTPNGKPQWSKSVLTRQARNGSETAKLVLDQRNHAKRAEFLRAWLGYVSSDDAIHATYHAGRVVTGRLSSSDPNMQQVNRELRQAFVPRPGYYLADFDYSQIEMRAAAFVSRSEPMIQAFREGKDLHTMLALRIIQQRENKAAVTEGRAPRALKLEDVTGDERQAGKSANFGLLYGMGAFGFREYAEDVYGVVLTIDEAVEIHHAFFDMWTGIREWHARTVTKVHRDGFVTSPLGRVRRLPSIWDGNDKMVSFSERAAINSPIQGFASDLMQMAAASVQGLLPGTEPVPGVRLVATVHDSIVAEVPIRGWESAAAQVQERMTGLDRPLGRMGVTFDVPLKADVKVGTRWGLEDISG